jgi:hypothetical protein
MLSLCGLSSGSPTILNGYGDVRAGDRMSTPKGFESQAIIIDWTKLWVTPMILQKGNPKEKLIENITFA